MRILVQPAVAYLGESKYPLDYTDTVLDLSPDLGLGAVPRLLRLIDDPAIAAAAVGEVFSLRRMFADHLPLTLIGLVAPDAGLLAMQEIRPSRAQRAGASGQPRSQRIASG